MDSALTEGCNLDRPDAPAPVFGGLAVAAIICLVAPLTQVGLNPARDLGPRLAAWLFRWGDAAFPDRVGGFLFVYTLTPLLESLMHAPCPTCDQMITDTPKTGVKLP